MKTFIYITAILAVLTIPAHAQLNPMAALYFQNEYLGNPAMAGAESGLKINAGYRKLWTNIPGSPSMQTLTADYALTDKAGLGLTIYSDKAGLFRRTRSLVSYAYHLPVGSNNQKLSFGLSLGFLAERVSQEDIIGDPGDPTAGNYNRRETYIDGDFGLAYTNGKLNIQASVPNLKRVFNNDIDRNTADYSTFFSAASYRLPLSTDFTLQPKVVFRGVKGHDNIVDAGANLGYLSDQINIFGMCHSTQSSTVGIGLNYRSVGINTMYTTATSALNNYANGNFEFGLKVKL